MIICKHCHKNLYSDDAKICEFCGKKNPLPLPSNSFGLYILISIILITIWATLIGALYSSGIFGNFAVYFDPDRTIQISYPIQWNHLEHPDKNIIVSFRPPPSRIKPDVGISLTTDNLYFIIPLNNSQSNIPSNNSSFIINDSLQHLQEKENYNLYLKIPWNITLDEYSKNRIDALKNIYSDLEYGKTTLAGNNTYNAIYTLNSKLPDSLSTKEYKIMQIWTFKNDKIYTITYMAEKSSISQ